MKKVLSIAFIFVLSLGLILVRPFDIYADSISSSNVIGVEPRILDYNVSVNPQSQTINGTTYSAVDYVIEFIVKLDSFYYGEITGDLSFYWDSYNISSNTATPVRNHTEINNKTYYVNGNSFIISYELRAIKIVNISHEDLFDPYYQITFSVDSSDVINYDLLEDYIQWDIPIESLPWDYFLLNKQYSIIGLYDLNYWNVPIFTIKKYDLVLNVPKRSSDSINKINVVCIIDSSQITVNSAWGFSQLFYNSNNYQFIDFELITNIALVNRTGSLCKVTISSDAGISWYSNYNMNLTPIYYNYDGFSNISTDFALQFGLSNQMLDDIHIIANGTQQSNNSSSNLEDMNDDYDDVSQQVFGLENNFSTGFDSSMQNVPTTFNFGTQFGNKFLATATWVRNQFDTMTTNTPFGALITFSLVLGLALLIVGRRLL